MGYTYETDPPLFAQSPSSQDAVTSSVQVLDRVMRLLDCFTEATPELGLAELAQETGLSKSTTHRMMAALEAHRVVELQPEARRYRLGWKLFRLGRLAVAQLAGIDRAEPFIAELAQETGDTAHLAVLDDGMTLYVSKVEGWRTLHVPSRIGAHLPPYCTGVGKALLAWLPEDQLDEVIARRSLTAYTAHTIVEPGPLKEELAAIRDRGYAVDNQEIEEGLSCVAAPVRDYTGMVVASVSVAGPTSRFGPESIPGLAAKICEAAGGISESWGATSIPEVVA